MCKVLKVSVSGFHAWLNRPPSSRKRKDDDLKTRIREIHKRSDETYGTPRIHAELADLGIHIGRKRVARLLKEMGLQGVSRRKWIRTTIRDKKNHPAPDLVNREFTVNAPDRLWVADITYIRTWTGWLYLAVVMDSFSRKIVGWAMANHLRKELVLEALLMAIHMRRPNGVIHHSDKGSQYTSIEFGRRCREAGVRPSTGSTGDCFDNAMAESFFASLECELLLRRTFRNQSEARREIFQYIEGWYNPFRRHSGINYFSPNRFEERFKKIA